jgi:UTP--glucose-1-phosphate uridylyltransferase
MTRRVRKAVIPAAGLGTRVLPASKSIPKEMLTVVDRPAIQHVVEEAVGAGIEDILIITSGSKKAVEDHFDRAPDLEALLQAKGKHAELAAVRELAEMARFHFTRQGEPLGLGHAVSLARWHVGDEPFAVLLPDEILADGGALLGALADVAVRTGGSAVALREVPMDEISRYGCPRVARDAAAGAWRIDEIVEKPAAEVAPSNLAVVGRYVFSPDIFTELERIEPGVGGELQLTDGMARLVGGSGLHGVVMDGASFDAGNRLEYLRAVVELALRNPEIAPDFAPVLLEIAERYGIAQRYGNGEAG